MYVRVHTQRLCVCRWPAGQGAQPLYNVSAALGDAVVATRRIGFRMFALVTGNDTDPAYVKVSE